MAGGIIDHGGEILAYIGDAVLAIFPIAGEGASAAGGFTAPEACARAVEAARDVARRIAAVNSARTDVPPIQYGIGLHLGDVTYGNIGIPARLQFTVIGPAANEASRIEGMTKDLDEPVVLSHRFAQSYGRELVSRGEHALKGVPGMHELFALPAAAAPSPEAGAGN
jgi:adenylate cyclase